MSDTTNTLAEQLVRAAEEALDENIRNPYDARAAVVAVLRKLQEAADAEIQQARYNREPWYGYGPATFSDWADEVESQS